MRSLSLSLSTFIAYFLQPTFFLTSEKQRSIFTLHIPIGSPLASTGSHLWLSISVFPIIHFPASQFQGSFAGSGGVEGFPEAGVGQNYSVVAC